jgi:hypothetical membrane protein
MESINKLLDKFYQKIPGSYWGIVGGILGLLIFLVASVLFSLTASYSIVSNAVSELGWGPNGSEPVFRIGMIILGCLLAPYVLFLTRFLWAKQGEPKAKLRNALNVLGIGCALIAVIGLFMVSIFGNVIVDDLFYLHFVGAFVYFLFAIIFTSIFALSMYLANKRNNIVFICTIAGVICGIACMLSTLPVINTYGLEGVLGLFKDKTAIERLASLVIFKEQAPGFPLTEWLFVLSTCVWFIIAAAYTLKLQRAQK